MKTDQFLADVLDVCVTTFTYHGWTQRVWRDYDGRLCALGAIDRAVNILGYDQSYYMKAKLAVQETIGEEYIVSWNDKNGQTREQVIQTFRDAAIKARPDAMRVIE